jgi:hypothetical protein
MSGHAPWPSSWHAATWCRNMTATGRPGAPRCIRRAGDCDDLSLARMGRETRGVQAIRWAMGCTNWSGHGANGCQKCKPSRNRWRIIYVFGPGGGTSCRALAGPGTDPRIGEIGSPSAVGSFVRALLLRRNNAMAPDDQESRKRNAGSLTAARLAPSRRRPKQRSRSVRLR